jgi:hypothetical protein
MRRPRSKSSKALSRPADDWLLPGFSNQSDVTLESSLLDVIDNVLNKGMVLNGDLVLGVANVDLIYAKLSVLLAALDKVADEQIFRPVAASRKRRRKKR